MKKRDLEQQLAHLGWWKDEARSKKGGHDKWTNGEIHEPVPRHREIDERLARKIIRTARNNPPGKT